MIRLQDVTKISSRLIERGVIEVAPLAFMRGRTLNDSFVILDEAQNTTSEQMKMFLTRLGFDSKAVVTGDITQIDLPMGKPSGMVEVLAEPVGGEDLRRALGPRGLGQAAAPQRERHVLDGGRHDDLAVGVGEDEL